MKKLSLAVALGLALASQYSQAEVRVNGFASVVGGMTLDENTNLFGYENELEFKNESMFALQVSADLQERLSATAQIVARGNNDFDAEFEWAYLTYEISDNAQFSAGRMRIPFYRYSDFLDVGYAYRWVRPPQSVYNLSFSTYEGVNFVYNNMIGDWDSTLQIIGGSYSGDIVVGGTTTEDSQLNDMLGINWTLGYDWFSARAAYIIGEVSIGQYDSSRDLRVVGGVGGQVDQLNLALAAAGFANEGSKLLIDSDDGSFFGIGFSIDYENILFDAEYTAFEVENTLLPEQEQYYASLGYRHNEFTWHVTYEHDEDEHPDARFNTIPETPAALLPLRLTLNAVLASRRLERETLTFGMRYDFHPAAAFKVDWSMQDDNVTNTDAEVLAFGVDLVF